MKITELMQAAEKAESSDNYLEAEGHWNDAVQTAQAGRDLTVLESLYLSFALFMKRRGRDDEARILDTLSKTTGSKANKDTLS